MKISNPKLNVWLQDLQCLQYIPRNMHTVFALLCFVVVIHWQIFPYPSGLLHWHCGNLTIAPVPAKQPWWIWINTSCKFIMNNCITTTKQSTTKPCAYFLGYTVCTDDTAVWHLSIFDSLWPSDGIWSTLAQDMAFCLMAPSHYLNHCLLIISKVLFYWPEGNGTGNINGNNHDNAFENYTIDKSHTPQGTMS